MDMTPRSATKTSTFWSVKKHRSNAGNVRDSSVWPRRAGRRTIAVGDGFLDLGGRATWNIELRAAVQECDDHDPTMIRFALEPERRWPPGSNRTGRREAPGHEHSEVNFEMPRSVQCAREHRLEAMAPRSDLPSMAMFTTPDRSRNAPESEPNIEQNVAAATSRARQDTGQLQFRPTRLLHRDPDTRNPSKQDDKKADVEDALMLPDRSVFQAMRARHRDGDQDADDIADVNTGHRSSCAAPRRDRRRARAPSARARGSHQE